MTNNFLKVNLGQKSQVMGREEKELFAIAIHK